MRQTIAKWLFETAFYGPDHASIGEGYLRFGVCKSEEGLELAKSRLRGLKKILEDIEKRD